MADTKISALTAATALTADDLIPIVDDPSGTPATKKITVANFLKSPSTAIVEKVVALSDGATPALDASLGNVFTLSAAGNRTIAVPTNPTTGQKIIIRHTASGAARTLALNRAAGGFRFNADVPTLTETAIGTTDYITAVYNAADSYWDITEYNKTNVQTTTPISGSLGNYTPGAGSETKYAAPIGYGGAVLTNVAQAYQPVVAAGTIKNFRVELSVAPSGSDTLTVSLMRATTIGGGFTAIHTVTLDVNGATGVDTDAVDIAAGDILYVQTDSTTAAGGSSTDIRWTAEFAAAGYGVLMGNTATNLAAGAVRYLNPCGKVTLQTSDAAVLCKMPTAGVLSNLGVVCDGIGGDNAVFVLYQNGAPTAMTVTVSSADTMVYDTINTVTYAAGDTLSLKVTPGGSISGTITTAFGFKWTPTTNGEVPLLALVTGVSNSSAEFAGPAGSANATATESDHEVLIPMGTLKKLYVNLTGSPGSGKSWADEVSVEDTPTALAISVADAATTANDTNHNITVADGNTVSIKTTPTGTPSAANHGVSMVYVGPGF